MMLSVEGEDILLSKGYDTTAVDSLDIEDAFSELMDELIEEYVSNNEEQIAQELAGRLNLRKR